MDVLDLDLDWSRRRDPQAYYLPKFIKLILSNFSWRPDCPATPGWRGGPTQGCRRRRMSDVGPEGKPEWPLPSGLQGWRKGRNNNNDNDLIWPWKIGLISVSLSVYLSFCLSFYLTLFLSICLSVCMSEWPPRLKKRPKRRQRPQPHLATKNRTKSSSTFD